MRSLQGHRANANQRKEKTFQPLSKADYEDLWAATSPEEDYALQEETANREELVAKLISQLPPRQQEAIRLRFVEELDFNEIAEALDVNRQSAQNLVFRAIEKLRRLIIPCWLLAISFWLKI